LPFVYNAQTEAEMKVQADKLFDSEQYLEATPLYLRLLSLQPRDLNYNYKYGTCLLFNSNRKQEAIRYLNAAVNDPNVAAEAYYFLGKALHLNYQFNEAIKNYNFYLEKRTNENADLDAERAIEMCQNGKRLMTTLSDIVVLDKKEITTDKFFRVYELNDIGGNLLVTAEFQTKLDKKNSHIPLIHFPQNPSVIYYSSYGENIGTGKDIYIRRKLPDGTWSDAQKIPGNVNTNVDEDFPYMHPDGNYLYFSSKGHNSMGGYDVFRSKYNADNTTFGPPENMDFAISSPDDDLFYVVDSLNINAYFASSRQSEMGKLFVYKVKVDRVPIQLAVVKGNFISEIDPSLKRINFQIRDFANGDDIGKFNSNAKSVYLITFPRGGKYEYIMTIEGSNQEFRSIVSIPFLKEFKPLKQKIVHTTEDGREVVKIINLFNEEVDDPQAVIAEVIKMRSALDVNVQEFNLEEIESEKLNKEILSQIGLGNLLMTEVSEVLKEQVIKISESKNLINTIENNINTLDVENSADFIRLEEQIKSKVTAANSVQNPESKYVLLKEAEALIKKQEELKKYSKDLLRLNDSVKNVLAQSISSSEEQEMIAISNQFTKLYQEGKEKEALQIISINKALILKVLNDNSGDLIPNLVNKVVKFDDEINSNKLKADGYNRELKDLDIEIVALKNAIYSAKSKDVPAIELKIKEKEEELKLVDSERNVVQKAIDKTSREKYKINQQIEILQDAISNKSIATVTNDKALKALAETEKVNSNTLTSYINQQIVELEKEDPSLKERIVVSSGLKGPNIFEEYKASLKGIQDDPSLSKEDRLYRILANERSAIRQLDLRLEEIENLLNENKFDEKLNKEKQAILTYKNEINGQISLHEKQVETLVSNEGVGDVETVITSIQPSYNENKNGIESNSNLSEKEKITALNREDEKLLTSVETELKKIDSQLIKTPKDKAILIKQSTLTKIKTETTAAINERTKELNSASEIVKTPNSEELITKISPTYSAEIAEITNSKTLAEKEKIQQLNKIDLEFIEKVNNEVNKIENQLEDYPSNKELQAEKELLIELKAKKEIEFKERINQLEKLENNSVLTAESSVLKENLKPGYEKAINKIEQDLAISSSDKLKMIQLKEKELLTLIDSEINGLDKQLVKDPTNKDLLAQKTELQQLQLVTESTIEEREQLIDSEFTSALSPEKRKEQKAILLDKINPGYSEKIKSINEKEGSESEKKSEELKIEEKLLENILTEENAVKKKLSKDPYNKESKEKLIVLNELKLVTENNIENLNTDIKAFKNGQPLISLTAQEKNEKIDLLAPAYKTIIESINSAELTNKEKAVQQLEEETQLLNTITTEKAVVLEELEKDPSNRILQKEVKLLEELKKDSEVRIAANEKLINQQEQLPEISENQINEKIIELNPLYSQTIQEIEDNSTISSIEKTQKRQIEDQKLLANTYDELEKVDQILSNNSTSLEGKTQQQILTALAAKLEQQIEKREQQINSSTSIADISESEKNDLIDQLDKTYRNDIDEIQKLDFTDKDKLIKIKTENQNLLSKVNSELRRIEEELSVNPTGSDILREKQILEAIQFDLQDASVTIEKQLRNVSDNLSISEDQKLKRIASIDPLFQEEKTRIESTIEFSKEDKLEQILALENEFLEKVSSERLRTQEKLNEDPTNNGLKEDLTILNEIQQELEESIATNKDSLKNSGESEEIEALKERIVASLIPDYESRKEALTISKMEESKKTSEFIKLESELLTQLQLEEKSIQKALNKDPENSDLKKRESVVKGLIVNQQNTLKELNERKIFLASNLVESEILLKIDKTFENEIARLLATESTTKNYDLSEREIVHQERIAEQIEKNNEILAKKDNPTVNRENEILKAELAESKLREVNYRSITPPLSYESSQKEKFVSSLREDLLKENSDILLTDFSTINQLKKQDLVLSEYENSLENRLAIQTKIIEKTDVNSKENVEAIKELEWLKDELNTIQTKRRKVKITIGQLEKIAVIEDSSSEVGIDDVLVIKLAQEEKTLKEQLTNPSLTKKERQSLQKELIAVQKEKAVQETKILNKEIAIQESASTNLAVALKSSASVNEEAKVNSQLALIKQKDLENQSQILIESASKNKNVAEKNNLLNEALKAQLAANNNIKEALFDNEVQKLKVSNELNSLETTSVLEEKKKRYIIQIGELTKLITILDEKITTSKGKETDLLKNQKIKKAEELKLTQQQLETVNNKLTKNEVLVSIINPEAIEKTVSVKEEQAISVTDSYRNYEEKAVLALAVEKQITNLEVQLIAEKLIINKLIAESLSSPSNENNEKVKNSIFSIKQLETDIQILRVELSTKQKLASESLPANKEEAMKFQNLVIRGIKPIQKIAIVAALVPLPANGLEINNAGNVIYSADKPIPVDVKNPSGLVYRVQVGAFTKPILQDLFKEFNPVSGEKLNNSNITRYMAGYFNKSTKVVEARDQIKALGYTDAFAVAYCDGKRITLAEARILEANGECVAKGENELMMEIATNTAENLGMIDSKGEPLVELPILDEYSYNQATGSVKAEPIEKHLGLFYTVQIGMFNKPIDSKTVYNIEPLMTSRLPNGQIRYSAGMYNSINDARPKKLEAIEKGIQDAFITAYHNGQRITLIEAQRILDEKGLSVLENNILKTTNNSATPVVIEDESKVEVPIKENISPEIREIEKESKNEFIQIVSKNTFEEFPREVLNRYNSHGSFYYDEIDKHVKSSISNSIDELPKVFYFKDDVDTVYLSSEEISPISYISVKFAEATLPGDFIDWLLRFNFRREFKQSEGLIELNIFDVSIEKMPELEAKLEQFGLTWTVEKRN
jgi:hypothetical protein